MGCANLLIVFLGLGNLGIGAVTNDIPEMLLGVGMLIMGFGFAILERERQ